MSPNRLENMIKLPNLLNDLYANRSAEELVTWLNSYELLDVVKRTVTQLNRVISDQNKLAKTHRSLPVGHIAANLLTTVNTRIRLVNNYDQAREMENILGDICHKLLANLMIYIETDKLAVWNHIEYALRDTCEIQNYDAQELMTFLKVNSTTSYIQSLQSAEKASLTITQIPAYCWKGRPVDWSDFEDVFVTERITAKKSRIHKLFNNPGRSLGLRFNTERADFILQFFYTLKKLKLVTHMGIKGFYEVLEFHVLDFRKEFLKEKDARQRINALKQSTARWAENQLHIEKCLKHFVLKTGPQAVPQA